MKYDLDDDFAKETRRKDRDNLGQPSGKYTRTPVLHKSRATKRASYCLQGEIEQSQKWLLEEGCNSVDIDLGFSSSHCTSQANLPSVGSRLWAEDPIGVSYLQIQEDKVFLWVCLMLVSIERSDFLIYHQYKDELMETIKENQNPHQPTANSLNLKWKIALEMIYYFQKEHIVMGGSNPNSKEDFQVKDGTLEKKGALVWKHHHLLRSMRKGESQGEEEKEKNGRSFKAVSSLQPSLIQVCSLARFKTHKETPCMKPESVNEKSDWYMLRVTPNVKPESPRKIQKLEVDDPSEVPQIMQMQAIASSNEVREALKDEHRQKLISDIDNSPDALNVNDCGLDANATERVLLRSFKPSLYTNIDYNALSAAVICRQISIVRSLFQAGIKMDLKVRVGAWSWDIDTGEETRVSAGLAEAYSITCFWRFRAMICARYKHGDCLKVLASAGADFGLVNSVGQSASSIAGLTRWNHGFQQAVQDVILAGKTPQSSNPSVFSPLMFTAGGNEIEALKKLLEREAIWKPLSCFFVLVLI
ncbi:hypothetical protein GOBAR_AA04392 [Gossypium barbadense]|uniref:Uncharacterized protein n=1 Tax=Gossypium barbadense TaxID=3634 RepID=A0A2P5YKR5_GOSBA|nr:hypothetical protein GOBAR_AA04392 [Gossypium barbadense]